MAHPPVATATIPAGIGPYGPARPCPDSVALSPLTATLLAARRHAGLSFADLGDRLGRDPVWVASLLHGQSTASAEEASALAEALGLEAALLEPLTQFPVKGGLDPVLPTDPLLYRFYEILQIYGLPLKDVIQEQFGDGIMSAIDFSLKVDRVADPAGDRVQVTLCGKFLPYKKW